MTQTAAIRTHYWAPYEPMVKFVESLTVSKKTVLEIGPGQKPFSNATEFVDWRAWPELEGKPVHTLNINQDALPFADKSFDFAYCRHTLEDLYNPFLMCREMDRVAKAGYIETPSAIAEAARGLDCGSPYWRGYHHHRYFVCFEMDTLMFLPKYPVVEHIGFGELESQLSDCLSSHPLYWNTYYFWEDKLRYRLLEHDKDFHILKDYPQRVVEAIHKSQENTKQLAARLFPDVQL